MRLILLIAAMLAGAASAQTPECDELWFSRNLILDRAGQCFATNLGRAVFDNGDCRADRRGLTPGEEAAVERFLAAERAWGCRVDTARTALSDPRIGIRRALVDLPVRDTTESACIGWRGAPVEIRLGAAPGAPVIGHLRQGERFTDQHLPQNGYTYIEVTDPNGASAIAGWAALPRWTCDMIAG